MLSDAQTIRDGEWLQIAMKIKSDMQRDSHSFTTPQTKKSREFYVGYPNHNVISNCTGQWCSGHHKWNGVNSLQLRII